MTSSRSEKATGFISLPRFKPLAFSLPLAISCNAWSTTVQLQCNLMPKIRLLYHIYFCMVSAHGTGTYNEPESRVSFAPQTHPLESLVLWDLSVDNPQLSHFHDKAFG